ncbi:unnamed protein product [Ilex paraguariensis]|uniref:Uncharacterized protein n=1 Tax=Ilex paraguariensis TaxID=185542 RepID=A0ABC8S7U1_9AQUA
MGACASKPKELKADTAATAPASAPEKEEVTAVSEAAKEVIKVVACEKHKEIVVDDTVDDNGNRRRSLSHLFKESEEGKDSGENDKISLELKQEPSGSVKAIDVSETPAPVVHDAYVKAESEKAIEVAPASGTETSKEKKTEDKLETETQKPKTPEKKTEARPAMEAPKPETIEGKKKEEEKPATEAPKPEKPDETKTEEEKLAAELQKYKTEEDKPATDTQKPETLA